MIEFRALRGDDVATLAEHAADDPDGSARITLPPASWWELVRTDPRRHGWIIEQLHEPIGYLDAEQDIEHEHSVVYLALLLFPAARGHRLAGEVLQRALSLPELAAASALIACVEPDNHPARRTLTSVGFVENGNDRDGLVVYRRPRRVMHTDDGLSLRPGP